MKAVQLLTLWCAEKFIAAVALPLTKKYCVRSRTYGSYSRCCNGVVYDRRRSVCCNGIQSLIQGYTGCCAGLMYSPSSHICCPDKAVRYKLYGPYTGCCGSKIYRFAILILRESSSRGVITYGRLYRKWATTIPTLTCKFKQAFAIPDNCWKVRVWRMW